MPARSINPDGLDSSNHTWDAEFEISTEKVAELVRTNTEIRVDSIRAVGEGWDFLSYLIDEEWIFRIPKKWHGADLLVREHNLMQSISLPISLPKHEYWVLQPTGFHMPMAGYRYLRGNGLHHFKSSDLDSAKLGKQIGTVLNLLHQSAFTEPRAKTDPCSQLLNETDELLAEAEPNLSRKQQKIIKRIFDGYVVRKRVEDHVSSHGDLGVEHVLVDDSGNLMGIIDWANAQSSNRYVDFTGLWAWGGDEFIVHVLPHYGRSPIAEDWAQIRLMGLGYILNQLSAHAQSTRPSLFQAALDWLSTRLDSIADCNVYFVPE